ncbi:protein of unknown function [Methylorubrum extorquens DM4]|uniref:Uncharacterized protein n=1 Tax=Methylorubrum extorquens (strain DSM 6343 / CIP 106787 / DM4) TaxID=661410 RepID=C7CGU2_METED|nr:protein of unknown function [Methylorubrum extorquens DM4]
MQPTQIPRVIDASSSCSFVRFSMFRTVAGSRLPGRGTTRPVGAVFGAVIGDRDPSISPARPLGWAEQGSGTFAAKTSIAAARNLERMTTSMLRSPSLQ